MSLSAYNISLEAQILSSDPVQLVDILYSLAIDSVNAAKAAHQRQDVFTRGRHVTKTFDILVELQHSLNFEKGGEIARNYARLYDYCQRRILEGHSTNSETCFSEVASLLADMKEAWQAVMKHSAATREAEAIPAASQIAITADSGDQCEAASVGDAHFA